MRSLLILATLTLALGVSSQAHAASIAYIDNGEVWLSSMDGTQKVRLAAPVANPSGAIDKWLDVAAADNGRIVAVRNQPGKISTLSWFKVWEPDGTSTVEGPLNALSGWALPVYPLSFDLTADGKHMVYGYSNSNCCPYTFARGTYVRPVTSSSLDPISLSGWEHPTVFGNRVIAHSGTTIYTQDPATPYDSKFTPWLSTAGTGLELRRTDVAANGQLAAFGAEEWTTGTQTTGKIGVVSINGVDQGPTGAVDCFVPASGVANDPSVSLDGRAIAWTDGQGLKVAGAPTSAADPCEMTSPAVVISPTGAHASIGGTNIAAFLPPAPPAPTPTAPVKTGTPGGATLAAPAATIPATVTRKVLGSGLKMKVTVSEPGKLTLTATVPAKAMGRKGKPVTIGTGSATAKAAGPVTVTLKLTAAARKRLGKLKGTKVTLKFVQNGRTTTKTVKLR